MKRIFGIPVKKIENTEKGITVQVSLGDLIKEKWFLDYVTKKCNEDLERKKFMSEEAPGL